MEEPIIPSSYYSVFIHVHRLYLSKSHLKINNGHTKHINDDLGLPANCVYETIFSSKEPVTKIVPIDELSAVFPSFLHYFRQQQQQHSNPNSFVSSPLSSSSINQFTSNTFRALSTIPRKSRNNKNCFTTTTPKTTTFFTLEMTSIDIDHIINETMSILDESTFVPDEQSDSNRFEKTTTKTLVTNTISSMVPFNHSDFQAENSSKNLAFTDDQENETYDQMK